MPMTLRILTLGVRQLRVGAEHSLLPGIRYRIRSALSWAAVQRRGYAVTAVVPEGVAPGVIGLMAIGLGGSMCISMDG